MNTLRQTQGLAGMTPLNQDGYRRQAAVQCGRISETGGKETEGDRRRAGARRARFLCAALALAGCARSVDNHMPPAEAPLAENEYAVTIAAGVKDFIAAEPRRGTAGTEITLTIKSGAGFLSALSAGGAALSRKAAGEWAFNLPEANVEVDAAFSATASADATLKSLIPSKGTLVPPFNAATKAYEIEVDYALAALELDFEAAHLEAGAEGARLVSVAADENAASVVVTAQDGASKETYAINVIRLPDAALKKVTVSGASADGYAFDGAPEPVTSDTIRPYVEYAEGKDTAEITYAAAFTKADGVTLTITPDSPDFTVSGLAITGVTLKLPGGGNPAAKSGGIRTRAAKDIAGKTREAGKSYTLVLERSGDPKYPKAKRAEGGEYHIVKNSAASGDYDIVHVFTCEGAPEIKRIDEADAQGMDELKVNAELSGAKVLVVAGGGGGGYSGTNEWYRSAGGGAGGLCYTDDETIPPGRYPVLIGLGGTGGANGRDSSFNGVEMKGGGRGASASGSYGSPAPGGSGGGGVAAAAGAAPLDARYGGKGGGGAGNNGGGRGYGGGGGGAGGEGGAGIQADHAAAKHGSAGGAGKTWEALGNIVTPALINVPAGLSGIGGGGNGNTIDAPSEYNGPGYGGGACAYDYEASPQKAGPAGYKATNAAVNNSGGGGGGRIDTGSGGSGGSGLVVVRYKYVQP